MCKLRMSRKLCTIYLTDKKMALNNLVFGCGKSFRSNLTRAWNGETIYNN